MAEPVLGIYREERFSPGKEQDDRAILDAAASTLRSAGLAVDLLHGDRLPRLARTPALIFAMCQSPEALAWLDEASRRTIVVNHPDSIRACYRINLVARLARTGISQPQWARAGEGFPSGLGAGPWLKRGDVHAMEAGDVRRVFTAEEWTSVTAEFRRRGIRDAIVQRHVEGIVYKFYGVGAGFFRAYGLAPEREQAALALARAGAAALGLEVYGGDGVCAADGSLSLIDFNDWPSFSRCRDEAGTAIGRRLIEILETRRTNGSQDEDGSAGGPRA
jgi:hypothetical protein